MWNYCSVCTLWQTLQSTNKPALVLWQPQSIKKERERSVFGWKQAIPISAIEVIFKTQGSHISHKTSCDSSERLVTKCVSSLTHPLVHPSICSSIHTNSIHNFVFNRNIWYFWHSCVLKHPSTCCLISSFPKVHIYLWKTRKATGNFKFMIMPHIHNATF